MAIKTKTVAKLRSFMFKPQSLGEINNKKSLYVPDQTMSLREIVDRFTSSAPLPSIGKEELFYSEDMEDLRFMDVTERVALMQEAKLSLSQMKADYAAAIKEERDIEEKKRMEDYKNQVIAEYVKQQNITT